MKQNEPLFTSRNHTGKPLSPRQLNRRMKLWAAMIGLDATAYGTESLRRTRAMHIMHKTGNLEAVRKLLGHTKIETTACIIVDDGGFRRTCMNHLTLSAILNAFPVTDAECGAADRAAAVIDVFPDQKVRLDHENLSGATF